MQIAVALIQSRKSKWESEVGEDHSFAVSCAYFAAAAQTVAVAVAAYFAERAVSAGSVAVVGSSLASC